MGAVVSCQVAGATSRYLHAVLQVEPGEEKLAAET
jgi:hypothetical protein